METASSPTVALAVDALRRFIGSNGQPPGSRLPGERTLAENVGVSRTTLRVALRRLADEGAIEGHPQRGWYLLPTATVSDRSTELESFTEIARLRGFAATSDVLVQSTRPATLDEADGLDIVPGAMVLDLERVRRLDGVPLCIDRSVLVDRLCHAVLAVDFRTASLYEALQRDCGIAVHRSSCTLQARRATLRQAELLDLTAGDPVLEVRATSSTVDGVVVLVSLVTYRGDSYRFNAELFRSSPFTDAGPDSR